MNRTGKKILKIFLIMLCAFIVFEMCGALVNVIALYSQHNKVIEIAENSGGKVWDIYSDIYNDYFNEIIIVNTNLIVYSENIDGLSYVLVEEFPYNHEYMSSLGVNAYPVEPFEPFWTYGDTDYSRHYKKINVKLKNRNNENYYIIEITESVPFKHNIITYLTNLTPIDPSMYVI